MEQATISYKDVSINVSHVQMREILAAYRSKFSRHQDELDQLDRVLTSGLRNIVRQMDTDRNAEKRRRDTK
jgi:Skp family chaperone for outer membrane proteins